MKDIAQKIKFALNPSPSDQRNALSARHEKSKASLTELRGRADALAIEGGPAFESACAAYAAMDVQVAAEANALARLDQAIAAEEAARLAAERKAKHAEAAVKVAQWQAQAEALQAKIAPLLDEAHGVIAKANRIYGYILSPVGREMHDNMGVPLAALHHTSKNCEAALSFLQQGGSEADNAAERVAHIQG
jgi:hypothetical protein